MKGQKLWFKSKDSRLIVWAVPLVSYINGIKSLNFFDLQFSHACMEIIPNFNGLLEVKRATESKGNVYSENMLACSAC